MQYELQYELTGKMIARDFRRPRRTGRLALAGLLGSTVLAGLAAAAGDSPARAAAAEDDFVDVTGLTAVSDSSLDDLRGGFSIGPFNINFGVMIKTSINQMPVLQTSFVVTKLGQISDLKQGFLHDSNPAASAAQAVADASQAAASAAQSVADAAQGAAQNVANAAQDAVQDAANAAQDAVNTAQQAVSSAQDAVSNAQDAVSNAQDAAQGAVNAAQDLVQDVVQDAVNPAPAQAAPTVQDPPVQVLASLPAAEPQANVQNVVETLPPVGEPNPGPGHAVDSMQDVLQQMSEVLNDAAAAAGAGASASQQSAAGTFSVASITNGVHISNGMGTEILQQIQDGVVTQILNSANGMDISHATELNLFITNFTQVVGQASLHHVTSGLALESIRNNPLLGQ